MRIGERLWISLPGPELCTESKRILRTIRPGGIVLYSRNFVNLHQSKRLTKGIREIVDDNVFIAIDHEGGTINRCPNLFDSITTNRRLGELYEQNGRTAIDFAFNQAKYAGSQLRKVGINVNLAPVLDKKYKFQLEKYSERCISKDSEIIARIGLAIVKGYLSKGVISVLKHYPGQGSCVSDPHLEPSPMIDFDILKEALPFHLISSKVNCMIMSGHGVSPNSDGNTPVTFSKKIITEILKGKNCFENPVMTDDLKMRGIERSESIESRVQKASFAGHDILLVCHSLTLQYRAYSKLESGYTQKLQWYGDSEIISQKLSNMKSLLSMNPYD